jgi:hypothetical protein
MREKASIPKSRLLACCVPFAVVVSGCADLVVTDVQHAQFSVQTLVVKATVKNEGSRDAPASTTHVDIMPAGSSTFTRSLTSATPPLPAGQQIEVPIPGLFGTDVPSIGSGQCLQLKACADYTNTVSEGWFGGEGNNCKTSSYCR